MSYNIRICIHNLILTRERDASDMHHAARDSWMSRSEVGPLCYFLSHEKVG